MSLVAGVCALWPYAAQRLPALGQRAEYKLTFDQIQISPAFERPVPADLVDQVRKLSDSPRDLSILDKDLTVVVANAFRRHPWVQNVVRVQKSFPASVVVELEFRRPVAMVFVPGGRIPIDINGVILPSADFSQSDIGRFPLIQNANSKPMNQPGTVWNDPSILAAVRLAHQLGEKWKTLKLEAISIPRNAAATASKDLVLELVGRGGSRIIWGRAPGNDHPGELEPTQKIRRLEKYLADFGDYGKPNGPYEIDIRHWQEISRHPLASDQAHAKPTKTTKEEARHHSSESKKKTRI